MYTPLKMLYRSFNKRWRGSSPFPDTGKENWDSKHWWSVYYIKSSLRHGQTSESGIFDRRRRRTEKVIYQWLPWVGDMTRLRVQCTSTEMTFNWRSTFTSVSIYDRGRELSRGRILRNVDSEICTTLSLFGWDDVREVQGLCVSGTRTVSVQNMVIQNSTKECVIYWSRRNSRLPSTLWRVCLYSTYSNKKI